MFPAHIFLGMLRLEESIRSVCGLPHFGPLDQFWFALAGYVYFLIHDDRESAYVTNNDFVKYQLRPWDTTHTPTYMYNIVYIFVCMYWIPRILLHMKSMVRVYLCTIYIYIYTYVNPIP